MDTPAPDSASSPAADDGLTIAGIAPAGLDTASADRPPDIREQQALQRAMTRLEPSAIHGPVRVGRFVLLEPIGTGAMGIVHGGYDDVLDRRVAIKLIRAERAASEAAQLRLVREAQAMAKLTHPGVVAVYEAGVHDGDVYLAMELVEGLTLRGWLREAGRSWREILRVFAQIADALAAAHDAGVLHRDFKPDNVLIGKDGKPKVADFGLAHLEGSGVRAMDSSAAAVIVESASGSISRASISGSRAREARLTTTGDVMGTPAYMSPEQCHGEECGPASDQFAFCVALFESLWGERPFAGDTLRDIMANVAAAKVRAPRVGVTVPAWVRAIVLRGLAAKPADRHPSMHSVAQALALDPRQRRTRLIATGAALTIGVAGISAGAWAWLGRERPCSDADTQIARVWSDDARTKITDAINQTSLSYAADTAARVTAGIDSYANDWTLAYVDACEATRVHQVQSEAALDLRMMCLGRARDQLDARVELLAAADTTIVEHSMQLVDGLPALAPCADLERLQARIVVPDDPAQAEALEELRRELARAFALHIAGKPSKAELALRSLSPRVHELEANALAAEVDFRWGETLMGLGRHDEAEGLLRGAMRAALGVGDEEVAARTASSLVLLLSAREIRFAEAHWLADIAIALAENSNDVGLLADVRNSNGGLLEASGRRTEAETEFRGLLELLQREYGADHLTTAVAHENLGMVLSALGKNDEAVTHHREAMAIRMRELGVDHPRVGMGHTNLGTTLQEDGRLDEAIVELRQGLLVLERALGAGHPDVALTRTNLGIVLDERGEHAAAQVEYRAALVVVERVLGKGHPDMARGYNNLGTSLEDQGLLIDAEAEFRRALAISQKALGEDHEDVARTRGNLASVLTKQGRADEALREAEGALAISIRILDPSHPDLAYARRGVGKVLYALAQARWIAGAHAEARSAATKASKHFRDAGETASDDAQSVATWLAAHGSP